MRRRLSSPAFQGGSVVAADAGLILRGVLCGGEPGSGKSALLNVAAVRAALAPWVCKDCPPDCPSCSGDGWTCECHGHAYLALDNEPDGWEVA